VWTSSGFHRFIVRVKLVCQGRKTMTIKIGDTLWGAEYGRPEQWRSLPVIGETKMSWLLGHARLHPIKVNKKTMLETVPNYGSIKWFTEQGKVDEEFRRKHAHGIGRAVESLRDVTLLRQIAEMIGYKVES
jgi:hypothetical protein